MWVCVWLFGFGFLGIYLLCFCIRQTRFALAIGGWWFVDDCGFLVCCCFVYLFGGVGLCVGAGSFWVVVLCLAYIVLFVCFILSVDVIGLFLLFDFIMFCVELVWVFGSCWFGLLFCWMLYLLWVVCCVICVALFYLVRVFVWFKDWLVGWCLCLFGLVFCVSGLSVCCLNGCLGLQLTVGVGCLPVWNAVCLFCYLGLIICLMFWLSLFVGVFIVWFWLVFGCLVVLVFRVCLVIIVYWLLLIALGLVGYCLCLLLVFVLLIECFGECCWNGFSLWLVLICWWVVW